MIGRTLDHYEITERLGQGGMGEVYLATDTNLGRQVALKFINPELAANPEVLSRFRREARAIAALNHPNIVTVHAVEQVDGLHFMTMEYVEGETLSSLLRRTTLPPSEVLRIAVDVFEAIDAAHRQGVTHRDLKPGNIMLTSEGRVKVLDFGLAKLTEEQPESDATAATRHLTEVGTVVGTIAYMSPEQVEGRAVDARSDIFSLGVVLYEMATGRLPFNGDSRAALMSSILREDPPSVVELRDSLPRHFGRIVKLCLVKNPTDRFQTASDVRIQLQELRGEIESGAHPNSTPKRRPWARLAGAVLLLAIAAVLARIGMDRKSASIAPEGTAAVARDSSFVVAIAPFWGATEEALAEGLVMQALVEREVTGELGNEEDVRILGKQLTEVVRSDEEARDLGARLDATAVIWGEVLVLRGEADIQAYITMIDPDPDGPLDPNQLSEGHTDVRETAGALEVSLAAPDQLGMRKAKAEEVGTLALLLASRFYERQDRDRALALLRKIDPPTVGSLVARARLRRLDDERERATSLLEEALALDPSSAEAHEELGLVYLWDQDREQAERVEAATREFERAIALAPDESSPWSSLAFARGMSDDDEGAIEAFEEALERDPRNAGTWHQMAERLALLERHGESDSAFERACRLAPNSTRNHVCYGRSLSRRHEFEEARAQFEAALAMNPDLTDARRGLARVLRRQGRYEEAIPVYRETLDRSPRSRRDWQSLAWALMLSGQFSEAITASARAVALDSTSAYEHIFHAMILARAGRTGEARSHAAGAVREDDREWIAPVLRYYAGELPEDAVWEAARDSVPDAEKDKHCEAYYFLGSAHMAGLHDGPPDTTRALEYFAESVKTGVVNYVEYDFSRAELGKFDAGNPVAEPDRALDGNR